MSVPAAYLGVILIWSTTPLGIQWSAQGASFSFAVMARMLVGLAICAVLLRATRTAFPFTAEARQLYLVSGLSIFVAMLLTYWGALHIPSGLISVIFGLSPLLTGVFAVLWLSERTLTPLRLTGLALALGGLWFIFGQPWPGDSRATLGTAAVLAGMTAQALGLVWIKRLNVRASPLAITTGSLGVATPLFVLAWVVADAAQLPADITPRAGAAIVYLGVFGSVVGFTLYYYVIQHLDAGRVALITLITPVSALLLGQALNAEFIPRSGWIGIALIGAGLLLYEWQALTGSRPATRTDQERLPTSFD
ncbi:MAG TPA: DMT family transporter [Thiobacillus sp.]|nr:MAG: EamA family transporter [Hydrogenophilales bacterium 28-61-11]OYZ57426.1 MAG: EamA family transporter [Hydrogenophilales bacterium 16-61-112]OZA50119.1 MAG: EamA family transporter [Hydrogenophilales bacterium 17-61-76]HQT30492.1 DMT family transporter [Thiobacillus sp.]HQT68896.1 DMT family transporter [Thiobacillus sp.]